MVTLTKAGMTECKSHAQILISFRPIPLVFLLLCLLLVFPGCERKSPPEDSTEIMRRGEATGLEDIGGMNLKDTRLATIPDDYEMWRDIFFSADGRKVFYRAIKRGRQSVVVNDKAGRFYDKIIDKIFYSPDGKRVAHDGKRDGMEYLVIDGKEVKSYDDIAPGPFSPDGRLVACQVEDKETKEWFIVVSDGDKEVYRSQTYDDTFRYPVFSPDGRLLVYELGERDKKTIFFLDISAMKIIEEQLCIECGSTGKFSFSSDSSRFSYEMKKEGKILLVLLDFALNEVRRAELPYESIGQVSLSPDGEKIVYTALKEGKHFIVKSPWESPAQGKENGPYEIVYPPVIGPNSATIAYLAMKEGKWLSVVGENEGPAYDKILRAPALSPDGARMAYPVMKNGKSVMVVSLAGNPAVVKEGAAYDMAVTPVFSLDGKYLAYRARTGTMENAKRFIVIADAETGKVIKEGPVNDEVWPPVWSADGKIVGYGVRIGRKLWWKVEEVP